MATAKFIVLIITKKVRKMNEKEKARQKAIQEQIEEKVFFFWEIIIIIKQPTYIYIVRKRNSLSLNSYR